MEGFLMAYTWDETKSPVISEAEVGGVTYYLKDAEARAAIDTISSYTKFLGVTTTTITDETGAVVVIDGEDVTAKAGDIVIKGAKEYIFNGTAWAEFGDLDALSDLLGDLAYNNTASADYTPAGDVNVTLTSTPVQVIGSVIDNGTLPTYTPTDATVLGSVTNPGTVPTFEATPGTVLTGVSTAGTLPTYTSTSTAVLTGVSTAGTVPSFTSTNTEVVATYTSGTLPTFSASLLTASVSGETLTFTLADNGFNPGTSATVTTSNVVATTTWDAGAMPTFKSGEAVATATFTQGAMPTFNSGSVVASTTWNAGAMPTFSEATVVGSATFDRGAMPSFANATVLGEVAVSSATFAGTASTITVSGSVSKPTV
jgi:hypothetical protein